jgi:hypothetical protein
MVHEVEVTEESSVLAACHKPEVRVVAAIRDYESAAGGEVARYRKYMGFCWCALKTQHR